MSEINIRTKIDINKTNKEVAVLLVRTLHKDILELKNIIDKQKGLLNKHHIPYCKYCFNDTTFLYCKGCGVKCDYCENCKHIDHGKVYKLKCSLRRGVTLDVWICLKCQDKEINLYL